MSDKAARRHGGCLFVFAMPFAAIGLFMLGITTWTLSDWWRMQGWVEVAAQVLDVHLDEQDNDDGTTYRAVAHYKYVYQGREYDGDRVAIDTTADNLGKSHQRRVATLERLMRDNESVPCFVNAESPDQSVLFRELRFEKLAFYLLFAIVFGGAGGGMMACGFYTQRRGRELNSREQMFPHEPWRWRADFAEGNIRSSSKASMLVAVFFAVMWNLVSSPVMFFLPAEIQKSNYLALIALLFPAIGIGLGIWAMLAVRRWFKYGESTLQMGSVPGVVGGSLIGVVRTSVKLHPKNGFRQTLSCVRRVTSGSGRNRSTHEQILWQTNEIIQQELAGDEETRSAIPVLFHIPYDSEPTSPRESASTVLWKLVVEADAPGADYHASFEVPVFRTADSSPDAPPDDSSIAPYVSEETTADVYRACGIRRQESVAGLRIEFPLFRSFSVAFFATLFLLIWTGAIGLMIHLGAPLFFPIIFGLFEALILCFALDLWLWRSELDAGPHGVSFRAGLVGFTSTRTFTNDQIKSITYESGMQSGQKLYYDVRLTTKAGKSYPIGKRVQNRPAAQTIVDDIKQAIGIEDAPKPTLDDSPQNFDYSSV